MHHQEPAAHPLLRAVQRIARDGLLNLRQQRFRVTDKKVADVFTVLEFRLQQFDRTADHAAFELHQASVEARLYMAANRPNAPSRPMFAVSIAEPFSSTVKSDRTEPSGK
jgi:hypothetical protein